MHVVKLHHGQRAHPVALYPGLPVDELSRLVYSVFDTNGCPLVGFEDSEHNAVPLRVACQVPNCMSSGGPYRLLLGGVETAAAAAATLVTESSSSNANADVAGPALSELNAQRLEHFVDQLAQVEENLPAESYSALRQLLDGNDELLMAALRMLELTGSAHRVRDTAMLLVAESMGVQFGAEGRWRHLSTQRALVRATDALYQMGYIEREDAVRLLHRVFAADPLIFAALEAYTADEEQSELFDTLVRIAAHDAGEVQAQAPQATDSVDNRASPDADADAEMSDGARALAGELANDLMHTSEISPAEHRSLCVLIDEQNDLVMAAQQVFASDGDVAELRDTLARIAHIHTPRKADLGLTGADQGTATSAVAAQNKQEQRIFMLFDHLNLPCSVSDVDLLKLAVQNGDALVLAAVQAFLEAHDEEDTVDTLVRLVKHYRKDARASGEAPASADKPNAGGDFNADDDDDDSESSEGLDDVSAARFNQVLDTMIESEFITADGARMLRQLFDAEDELVCAAWKVFLVERSARELVDTLVRIVRHKSSDQADAEEDEEFESDRAAIGVPGDAMSALVDALTAAGKLTGAQSKALKGHIAGRNTAVLAAFEAYLADHDESELVETLALVAGAMEQDASVSEEAAQSTTATSVFDFIADLEQQQLFSAREADVLRKLVAAKDDMVLAAFDVYDSDESLHELLDTLGRILGREQQGAHSTGGLADEVQDIASESESESDSDDHDEDYAPEAESATAAATQLLELVQEMQKDANLSPAEAQALRELVKVRDDSVMAAYDVYSFERDVEDLVDSLQRIARRWVAQRSDEASDDDMGVEGVGVTSDVEDDIEDEQGVREIREVEAILRVLKTLYRQQVLSLEQTQFLMRCLEQNDPVLLGAFDVFEQLQDVGDLVDTLERICLRNGVQDESEDGEDSESVEEDETDDVEDSKQEDDRPVHKGEESGAAEDSNAAAQFAELMAKCDFPPTFNGILVQRFLVGDPVVRAAVQVYQFEEDLDDLKDTLVRVVANHNAGTKRDADKRVNADDAQPQEEAEGSSHAMPRAATDDEERGMAMVQAFSSRGMLSEPETTLLSGLVQKGDVVIMAALDAYGVSQDLEELHDTLKRLVRARGGQ